MDLEKRLDIYKAEYYFQIDFKEKLYARLAIYAVLLTGCITANITMFDILKTTPKLVLVFCSLLTVAMLISLFFTLYGFYSLSHIKVDHWTNTPNDMEAQRNRIEQHFIDHTQNIIQRQNLESMKQEYVKEEFTIYLVEQFSQCATIIRDNNVYRQRWLVRIMSCTYAVLIITGILGFIYLIKKI